MKYFYILIIVLLSFETTAQRDTTESIHYVTEISADFPGGMEKCKEYIQTNLKYPQEALDMGIEGKVYVKFVVTKEGNINSVEVVKGINPLMDKEAKRLIQNMPKWSPGIMDGKPVPCYFLLPVHFNID
jgi:TonB family protein